MEQAEVENVYLKMLPDSLSVRIGFNMLDDVRKRLFFCFRKEREQKQLEAIALRTGSERFAFVFMLRTVGAFFFFAAAVFKIRRLNRQNFFIVKNPADNLDAKRFVHHVLTKQNPFRVKKSCTE